MSRRLEVAIALCGLAASSGALLAWYTNPGAKLPLEGELARVAVGLSFVVGSILASAQFGNRRIATLMAAVGLTWFIWDLAWIYQPLPYTVGLTMGALFEPILAQLAIVFPSGRLQASLDRAVVALGYASWFVFSLALQALWDPQVDCPGGCSANLLLVHPDANLHSTVETAGSVVGLALTAVVVGLVIQHWLRASLLARRALAPVLWSSWPMAGVLTAYSFAGRASMSPLAPLVLTALPIGFLAGLLRMHLTRAAVGRLVIELGQPAAHTRLRDALAKTLGDPALEVLYWSREQSTFVDQRGCAALLPPPGSSRIATVVQGDDGPIAALMHDAALQEDPELLRAAAAAARLAIDNERLQAEIRTQLQEVRASRTRLVEASDAARRRLERDLHDGSQQRLVTLAVQLSLAQARLGGSSDPELSSLLAEAIDELRLALDELRQLARGIHPAILSDAGLGPALAALAERSPLAVTIAQAPGKRSPPAVEAAAYFMVAESLTNAAKHAQATMVTIRAEQVDGHLHVEIRDDGIGGADVRAGSGLQGLADRIVALDGRLEVDSPPGGGTRVAAVIPCRS